jgi:hypothetical protein
VLLIAWCDWQTSTTWETLQLKEPKALSQGKPVLSLSTLNKHRRNKKQNRQYSFSLDEDLSPWEIGGVHGAWTRFPGV